MKTYDIRGREIEPSLLDDAGVVEAAIRRALFEVRCETILIERIIDRLRDKWQSPQPPGRSK